MESNFIHDNYNHLTSKVFYCITRTPGKGVSESDFQCFEFGCDCPDSQCTIVNNCSCLKYGENYKPTNNGLVLVKEKFLNLPVFECNTQCSCFKHLNKLNCDEKLERNSYSGLCPNRCVQFGPIEGLEIFDAGAKGLGLRTKHKIPSGSFICEYAGEIISLGEAEKRQKTNSEMNYIFILREFIGKNLSSVTCVDPTVVGNIGRYINHSCQPNSAIVPVRVDDNVPLLCVFALRDIEENEEICYDYSGGENSTSEFEYSGSKPCFCNSVNCKQFLPFQSKII